MKKLFGMMAVVVVLAGCGQGAADVTNETKATASESNGKISVVASFYPLAYMAEKVGGDSVEVTNIVGAADPHDYTLSPGDIRALQDADVVLLQGADLEPWGEDMAEQLRKNDVRVVTVTDHLTLAAMGEDAHEKKEEHVEDDHDDHDEHEDEHEDEHADEHGAGHDEDEHEDENEHDDHNHGAFDPHTWLDPVLAAQMVGVIEEALHSTDESQHEIFEANAQALAAQFADLDAAYKAGLATCQRQDVIISHDAFGYLASRYGFTAHGIAGISTQDEPSAAVLAQLKDEAAEGMTHILTEENTAGRFAATLSKETGLTLLPINTLAAPARDGADFIGRATANLSTLQTSLGCS